MVLLRSRDLFFRIVALAALLASAPAAAQNDWADDAVEFAESQADGAFTVEDEDWERYEASLQSLNPASRIERSQELVFVYLNMMRFSRLPALEASYLDLLRTQGSKAQKKRQLLLDAYALLDNDQNIEPVLAQLNAVMEREDLGRENRLLGYIMAAYLEVDFGETAAALRRLQSAEMVAQGMDMSPFMEKSLASATAYVLMESGDFAGSLASYKEKARHDIAPMPFDSASDISNTMWMLQEAGHYSEALQLNQILGSRLSERVYPTHRYFVFMSCARLATKVEDFDLAISCLDQSRELAREVPVRWVRWRATYSDTMARAGRLEEASAVLKELKTDPIFQESEFAASFVTVADALITARAGGNQDAIRMLVNHIDSEALRHAEERHAIVADHRALIDRETEGLQRNAVLQESLLVRQTVFTGLAIGVCIALWVLLSIIMRKRRRERVLSITDPLTGLHNRRGFDERFCALHTTAAATNSNIAIGMVDLDGFKAINDMHGHAIGDAVLVLVAERLRESLGSDALLGRLGGDEFAFVTTGVGDEAELADLARGVLHHVTKQHNFGEAIIAPQASIGIAFGQGREASVTTLYDRADFTLYSTKGHSDKAVGIFDKSHSDSLAWRRKLETALATACADEFEMRYQPIVDARTGLATGCEALARWNSPVLGEVSPEEFIPLAERLARIRPLTLSFLETALEDAKSWPDTAHLSFNLSSHDLRSKSSAYEICKVVALSGFPAERIVFEVTETAMVEDTNLTREALTVLSESGAQIALDDYGTGYSSLLHLHNFTINRIKVDRSLTSGLELCPDKRNIVNLLVNMSNNLGIDCVVEGVENEDQVVLLNAMQVQFLQGYLFAVPMDNAQLNAYFADQSGQTAALDRILRAG